jgi:hypothetical protein
VADLKRWARKSMITATRRIGMGLAGAGAYWLILSIFFLPYAVQTHSWEGGFLAALGTAIWVGWLLVALARTQEMGEGFIWALSVIYHGFMVEWGFGDRNLVIEVWGIAVGAISFIAFVIWLCALIKKPNQPPDPTPTSGAGHL